MVAPRGAVGATERIISDGKKGRGQGHQSNVDSVDNSQRWNGWSASGCRDGSNRGSGGGRGSGDRGDQDRRGKNAGRGAPFGDTSGVCWPSAGQHQENYRQRQGSQDSRQRCHRCDRIGHTKAQCHARVIFEDDPKRSCGANTTYAHGVAAQLSDPPLYNSAVNPPPPTSIGPSASHAGSLPSTPTYSMFPYSQAFTARLASMGKDTWSEQSDSVRVEDFDVCVSDCGAPMHMVADCSTMNGCFVPTPENSSILIGNIAEYRVECCGNLT